MRIWLIAVVVILDQGAKQLALRYLDAFDDPIVLIPGFLGLKLSFNSGAALSLFRSQTLFLSLFTILAIALVGWMSRQAPRDHRWLQWGYALILGGAIGNLIDRLFRGAFLQGSVVDFVQFPWFINNIADDAICVGVALVAIGIYLYPATDEPPAAGDASEEKQEA